MKKVFFAGIAAFVGWGLWESYGGVISLTHMGDGDQQQPMHRLLRREGSLGLSSLANSARGLPAPRLDSPRFGIGSSSAPPSTPALLAPTATISDAANTYFQQHKSQWNVQDYHELRPTVIATPMGGKVRYSAFQDGLPILGLEIALDVDPTHQVSGVQSTYAPVKRADLGAPVLSQEEVLQRNGRYALDEVSTSGITRVLYVLPGSDEPELAYVIPVRDTASAGDEKKGAAQIIFRAADGQVLGNRAP